MFWSRDEEETFKPKKEEIEELEEEQEEKKEVSVGSIMEKLETISQQVNLISNYLSNISQRVSKAIDASVAYQKDLDYLENRIELLRSKLENLENVVPEIELKKKFGKSAG